MNERLTLQMSDGRKWNFFLSPDGSCMPTADLTNDDEAGVNMNPLTATPEQQKYHDMGAYYVYRAVLCASHELWPEAEMNFGAALESLLRINTVQT